MIGIILGVVGLAGGGGIAALIARFGLPVVLRTARAGFSRVPRWAWIALAAAALLIGGYFWHQHKAHAAIDTAVKAAVTAAIQTRDQQWQKRLNTAHSDALAWKGKFDAEVTKAVKLQRKLTDEENRRIDADAGALRLRGPGHAAAPANCRPGDHSGLPGIAGRHDPQPGAAANARTEVPAGDGADQWAVVPWNWAVDVVSERDAFRVEAIAWRGWHATIAGMWERMRQQAPKSSPPTKGTSDGR